MIKKSIISVSALALIITSGGCTPNVPMGGSNPMFGVSIVDAKGASGGGARGGTSSGARSSGAKGAGRGSGTGGTSKAKPAKPKATVVTDRKKPSNKGFSKKGKLIDNNYKPSFRNGYNPPTGTVVYERSSAWDWLPLYYVMTHNGEKKEAVAVEPDGKEVKVKEEGKDSMYVINWILLILLSIGLIVGLIWLVNKLTSKKEESFATY